MKEESAVSKLEGDTNHPQDPRSGSIYEASAPFDPERTDLHELIARLPEERLDAARRFLRFLIVDSDQSWDDEWDNEPLSAEDRAAIAEARKAFARGEFNSLDELERFLDDKGQGDE